MLAVALRGVVMNADYPAVIVGQHALQAGSEDPSCLARLAAEVAKGRLAALVVAGKGAVSRRVP